MVKRVTMQCLLFADFIFMMQAGPSMPILDDTITVDDSMENEDADVDITDDEYHDAAEPMEDDDFFSQSDIVSRYLLR